MPSPSERVVAGRYRLRRQLGRGSMGIVWEAYDEFLRRPVSVKEVLLPPGIPQAEADELRERTLREARAIAALSHPNVITLHDVAREGGEPFVVTEYLLAHSLAALVRVLGPLPVPSAAAVADAVAAGLAAAHQAGITHRDVKPGNVLIGVAGQVKLSDFGIARNVSEHTLTSTGIMLGSPAYIAPEVAAGREVTPAADLWGLGATLFAVVEGRPPYDADGTALDTVNQVVHGEVPRPSDGPLGAVITALMRKDPAERISLAEVRNRLHPLLPPPSTPLLSAAEVAHLDTATREGSGDPDLAPPRSDAAAPREQAADLAARGGPPDFQRSDEHRQFRGSGSREGAAAQHAEGRTDGASHAPPGTAGGAPGAAEDGVAGGASGAAAGGFSGGTAGGASSGAAGAAEGGAAGDAASGFSGGAAGGASRGAAAAAEGAGAGDAASGFSGDAAGSATGGATGAATGGASGGAASGAAGDAAGAAAGGASESGAPALASAPGPLPFEVTVRRKVPRRRGVLATSLLVFLSVLLFGAAAGGGFALARHVGGEPLLPPERTKTTPTTPANAPRPDGLEVRTGDAATLTGAQGGGYQISVPRGWVRFVEERVDDRLPNSTVVYFVSPDGTQTAAIERLPRFYPDHNIEDYLAELDSAAPDVTFEPFEQADIPGLAGAPGGPELAQHLVYRTTANAKNLVPRDGAAQNLNRVTFANLLPYGNDLWVVSVTVPIEQEVSGETELFDKIVPGFRVTG